MLLRDLTAPTANGDAPRPSQIDDLSYERVIERADVLASGGEFDLTADADSQAIEATTQLAAVLDMLPSLLIRVREEVANNPADSSLSDSLEMLSQTVKELQQSCPISLASRVPAAPMQVQPLAWFRLVRWYCPTDTWRCFCCGTVVSLRRSTALWAHKTSGFLASKLGGIASPDGSNTMGST